MISNERQAFSQFMTSIAELYQKKLSPPLLEIYWHTLEPYPLETIKTALRAHVLHPDSGQFMPKPADILRFLGGNGETQALQAWSKVLKAIRNVGSYDSIVFDDSLIHVAIQDLGGWNALCQHDAKSLVFVGKQFERIYSSYLQQKPKHYPKHLTGFIEHQNTQIGRATQTIRFLGNKAKALEVWQNGCEPEEYTRLSSGTSLEKTALKALPNASKSVPSTPTKPIHSLLPQHSGETSHEQD